jgi:hypothetical protein
MTRIEPFHVDVGPWRFAKVYHDNDGCIAGNAIPKKFRIAGKREFLECRACQVLNKKKEHKKKGPPTS